MQRGVGAWGWGRERKGGEREGTGGKGREREGKGGGGVGGKGCRFGLERGPLRRKSGYGDGGEKYGGLMSVCVCVCVCVCV